MAKRGAILSYAEVTYLPSSKARDVETIRMRNLSVSNTNIHINVLRRQHTIIRTIKWIKEIWRHNYPKENVCFRQVKTKRRKSWMRLSLLNSVFIFDQLRQEIKFPTILKHTKIWSYSNIITNRYGSNVFFSEIYRSYLLRLVLSVCTCVFSRRN